MRDRDDEINLLSLQGRTEVEQNRIERKKQERKDSFFPSPKVPPICVYLISSCGTHVVFLLRVIIISFLLFVLLISLIFFSYFAFSCLRDFNKSTLWVPGIWNEQKQYMMSSVGDIKPFFGDVMTFFTWSCFAWVSHSFSCLLSFEGLFLHNYFSCPPDRVCLFSFNSSHGFFSTRENNERSGDRNGSSISYHIIIVFSRND